MRKNDDDDIMFHLLRFEINCCAAQKSFENAIKNIICSRESDVFLILICDHQGGGKTCQEREWKLKNFESEKRAFPLIFLCSQ